MSDETELTELSEAEQEQVGRGMVRAAFAALGEPPGVEAWDSDEVAQRVLRALIAAEVVRLAEAERFAAQGKSFWMQEEPAVATAYWMWASDLGFTVSDVDDEKVAPECYGGTKYLAFAQAMAAAQMMSTARGFIEDGSVWACCADGAKLMVESIQEGTDKPLTSLGLPAKIPRDG